MILIRRFENYYSLNSDQQAGERRRRRDADGDEGEGRQPVKRMKRPVPTLTVDR